MENLNVVKMESGLHSVADEYGEYILCNVSKAHAEKFIKSRKAILSKKFYIKKYREIEER